MGPIAHTGVSVAIGGAVWVATGEPLSIPVAFVAGAFNDVDHLLDYYNRYYRLRGERLFLLFHGWEYVVAGAIALVFIWHPLLLAGVLGHLSHVLLDTAMNNKMHKATYFMSFRAANGFRSSAMMDEVPHDLSAELNESIPFWRFVEPTLMRWSPYRKAADYKPELE